MKPTEHQATLMAMGEILDDETYDEIVERANDIRNA